MNCTWARNHLHSILDGEVSPEHRAALDEHLEGCTSCAEMLRSARAEERTLSAAMPCPGAPPGLVSAAMAQLGKAGPARDAARAGVRWWRVLLSLGAAAALVVVGGVVRHYSAKPSTGEYPAETVSVMPAPEPDLRRAAEVRTSIAATLQEVVGTVLRAAPDSEDWTAAAPGDPLFLGARLKTDGDAHARATLGNRASLLLDGKGIIRIEERGAFVESGRLFAWVEQGTPEFAVRTPHATAVVKGTQFNVDCRDADTTQLSVVRGLVVLSNDKGSVDVGANMQSVARVDQAPAPALYADLLTAVAWAGIEDNTLSFAADLGLRVRPQTTDGVFAGAAPAFAAEIDYKGKQYAELWLYCRIDDADGNACHRQTERVCTWTHRYRVKKVSSPSLPPGQYRASFRIGHGDRATVATADFSVQ